MEKSTKAAKPKIETVEEIVYKGSQSIEYRHIYKINGFKIKLHIDRDSYKQQSHATAYVWSPEKLEWNAVYSIPSDQLDCLKFSYVSDGITAKNFAVDADRLRKQAAQIIF